VAGIPYTSTQSDIGYESFGSPLLGSDFGYVEDSAEMAVIIPAVRVNPTDVYLVTFSPDFGLTIIGRLTCLLDFDENLELLIDVLKQVSH
jgi:hypothetical protein